VFLIRKSNSAKMTAVRQNFHQHVEAAINKQINMELFASYVYTSMWAYYERDDVALFGIAKFFKEESEEENEHAQKLMKYQVSRGGRVVLSAINPHTCQEWDGALKGLSEALILEKEVNQSLLDMHKLASQHNDAHLTDFLENHYLETQVKSIKKLADMITRLQRAGTTGLGEHIFDKELQSKLLFPQTLLPGRAIESIKKLENTT